MSYGVTYRLAWKRLARVAPEFHANGNGPDTPRPSETIWPAYNARPGQLTVSNIGNPGCLYFFFVPTKCSWHEGTLVAVRNDFGSRIYNINPRHIGRNESDTLFPRLVQQFYSTTKSLYKFTRFITITCD